MGRADPRCRLIDILAAERAHELVRPAKRTHGKNPILACLEPVKKRSSYGLQKSVVRYSRK